MTEGRYVGAIDQGTTGTRFVVFDHDGRIAGEAYATHEQRYPRAGWVEHDPTELWGNTERVLRGGLADADIEASALVALGVATQRETTVCWDADTGDPVADAIVWQDRRTADRIDELDAEGKTDRIRDRTGLEPDAYFSASKAEWLLEHAGADLRARAADGDVLLGTVDAWLIYKLTGGAVHATDVTNAARTMLYDIHAGEWADDLLDEFGVPEAALPTVRPSSDPTGYGTTDSEGVLGTEVPVAAAFGDQQAALFGQTCFEPGEAKNTYGTGSFVLMNTGETAVTSEHGLLTTVAFQRAGEPMRYALEGSIFVTGAAIEWLETLGVIEEAAETEALARSVDSTDDVYFVPAFAGLGAPHWDQHARGTVVGLTRGTERAHLARAALEAIAYRTRDVVDAMTADAGTDLAGVKVDGGVVANDFLCAYQAAVLGTPVRRPVVRETTALGAAYAAGLAVGFWSGLDALRDTWRLDRAFDPADVDEPVGRRYDRWGEALERARGWAEE